MTESEERANVIKKLIPLIQGLTSVAHDLLSLGDHEKLHEVTGHLTSLETLRGRLNIEAYVLK